MNILNYFVIKREGEEEQLLFKTIKPPVKSGGFNIRVSGESDSC
jgi:hypothetical protein